MSNIQIEFSHVNFSYDTNEVLHDISFQILEGDYIGFVGGNGSGKTTILKLMLNLLIPQSGEVTLFDSQCSHFKEWYRIGYVPQHVSRGESTFSTTVREIIESGLVTKDRHWVMLRPEDAERIQWAMEVTQTTHLEHRMLHELSGGERQLVFIARALVSKPNILVLDEPTTGVDANAQDRFYGLLTKLNSEHNLTIILVSHDLEVIAREVKTVICVNQSLVCNVSSKEFIEGDYLKQIYGDDMKYIHHTHNH